MSRFLVAALILSVAPAVNAEPRNATLSASQPIHYRGLEKLLRRFAHHAGTITTPLWATRELTPEKPRSPEAPIAPRL